MDTILVAVVVLALIIMSTLTMIVSVFQSANNLADSWQDMESQSSSIKDTGISATGNYSGGLVDVAVQNAGGTNLYDYPNWDVIIQYQSGDAFHLPYAGAYPPGSGGWAIEGIFMAGGSPEVFNPNILDPGEIMIIAINPEMEIGIGETVRIVISTPNGVTSQCFITR
jgi:hypothetical protein